MRTLQYVYVQYIHHYVVQYVARMSLLISVGQQERGFSTTSSSLFFLSGYVCSELYPTRKNVVGFCKYQYIKRLE